MQNVRRSIVVLALVAGLEFVTAHAQAKWSIIKKDPAVKLVVDTNGIYYLAQNVGVAKSTDQGQTWAATSYGPPARGDYNNAGGAAASSYGVFIDSLDQGIWRSTDNGTTWVNTFRTGFGTGGFRMLSYGDTLLTTYGGFLRGLYKWNPDTSSWDFKYNPPPSVDGGSGDFSDFTVDDRGSIYVTESSDNHFGGVFKSTDQGETWSQVLETKFSENPTAIEWWNGNLVAIRSTRNLGVIVSADRGATWQALPAVNGVNSEDFAHDMAVGFDGMLYACFSKAGVRRTSNLAQGWTDFSNGLPALACRNFTVVDGSLFVATERGLARLVSEIPVPHSATAVAQVVNGFVVGATITDGGSGYTNAPVVTIAGDGGGAAAVATVVNGAVSSLKITNPGSGYSSATITMAPPPLPPRRSTGTSQIINGFVVGLSITDGGFGYEAAPVVLLSGGGGSGATAVATVLNGVVTAINVTNPGTGYTSAPRVSIASPPFSPRVAIVVSKVKVQLSVVLGRKYQLEASFDLKSWTATDIPFVAQAEELVQEFDVEAVGRYFRIKQLP